MSQQDIFLKLADALNFPLSRYLPRIFEKLITPLQGEMLLLLPATTKELADSMKIDEGIIGEGLEDLVRKGLVIPRIKDKKTSYFFVRSTLQFHDSSGIYEPAGEEFQELWKQWRETEFYELCREWERMPVPLMRVFPYPQAVKNAFRMLPHEDLNAIIAGARKIAVVKCVCRLLMKHCQRPLEVCMTFDAAADFALRRGVGKAIHADEAREISRQCSQEGMVPSNLNGARVTAMCFCCPDCCIFIQPQRQYGYRLLAPSRYEAVVDSDTCNGCQSCGALCHFAAIQMEKSDSSESIRAVVRPEKCYGCGVCVVNCPVEAITLKPARPPDYIPEFGPRY